MQSIWGGGGEKRKCKHEEPIVGISQTLDKIYCYERAETLKNSSIWIGWRWWWWSRSCQITTLTRMMIASLVQVWGESLGQRRAPANVGEPSCGRQPATATDGLEGDRVCVTRKWKRGKRKREKEKKLDQAMAKESCITKISPCFTFCLMNVKMENGWTMLGKISFWSMFFFIVLF